MELNDILRILFRGSDMNYISVEGHILTISIYLDWIYDGEGGFNEAQWDLRYEFLSEQSKECQDIINQFLDKNVD